MLQTTLAPFQRQVDVSQWAAGVYLFRFFDENGRLVGEKRVVVQR